MSSRMLDLIYAFAGCPVSELHFLPLPKETLLVYPFNDSVVILNARSLAFLRSLAFWEVFPGAISSGQPVKCVTTDPGMKLIVASLGAQISIWSLSGFQQDTWRVHSSLTLPDGHVVTSLDCMSGLLAVGSPFGLSVFTLMLENDLPTWSKKWSIITQASFNVRFSPSLTLLATTCQHDNTLRIYSTTAGRQIQTIRHPRPITKVRWRFSRTSSRDDLILYTVTSDATLRIFLPVLDAPQRLQLHASLDLFSATSPSYHPSVPGKVENCSNVFWVDRDTMADCLSTVMAQKPDHKGEDSRYRRIQDMDDEKWDFFVRILHDGSLVLRAVANIDRRPPTLLKQFDLLHYPPSTMKSLPSHLYFLSSPASSQLTLVTSPPLTSQNLEPLSFFDGQKNGLTLNARDTEGIEKADSRILRFVRTPEGRAVGVIHEGNIETWHVRRGSTQLRRVGRSPAADHVVVLNRGEQMVVYLASSKTLTLQPFHPPVTLSLPHLVSLFCLPSSDTHTSIFGVTSDVSIVHIRLSASPPALSLHSHTNLPTERPPKMILPVDPMAWSDSSWEDGRVHDVLLSVADDGELAFWIPEEGKPEAWVCTGRVRTGRTGFSMARCSSAKKSALVIPSPDGEELTIWDSNQSEFASGLEYRHVFSASERINDLDWTSTPDLQSILAVGFAHHVVLLCQQRMTYFNEDPAWHACSRIEIGHMTPHPISDSIWLTGGSLLVGAGYQMFQFGKAAISSPASEDETNISAGLFEYVARVNGPLEDYHPQMMLQCLLWGKVVLVKEIIVNLARDLDKATEAGKRVLHEWQSIPVERFFATENVPTMSQKSSAPYSLLFDGPYPQDDNPDDGGFSRHLVQRLIEQLEAEPLSHLTPNEHAHLIVLIQTTLEIEEQRRALDANGLRYLISMRSFYILNTRASHPGLLDETEAAMPRTGRRERLRYRDIVWAFHSESQEILLSASTAACGGKMTWSDARALGVFLWLNSVDSMKAHMEVIARNHYMAGDNRDPTACCLYYFALGKMKLVHGLWKQAAWHKEQNAMLKFLSNDFSEPRWRTAALKNAYALLSKQRPEYAAAFFLLGGALKDAVNVCVKQLHDFQLGIALARVVEHGDDGPVLKDVLTNVVIPLAFQKGNRWLGSWAFWLLRRRDLAVRILVTPLEDITESLDVRIAEIGDPNYDDPSLALLFSQLKSKTLQAAKGTSEISGRTEFKFVLQTARVFCRMGCHALALDLVRSWSFDRPTTPFRDQPSAVSSEEKEPLGPLQHSPTFTRRSGFALPPHIRRRSSIIIDMEVPSATPTRATSPEPATGPKTSVLTNGASQADGDLPTRKAGLGSLMTSAKQDVKVPEFNMDAFF